MTASPELGWLWGFLFLTISGVFVAAEQRQKGRGLGLIAMMTFCLAITSASAAATSIFGPSLKSLLIARVAISFGLCASALNTHFLCAFFEYRFKKTLNWASYVLVGAGALANLVATGFQAGDISLLVFPIDYWAPSQAFLLYFFFVLITHSSANFVVLRTAMRQGRSPARGIFITTILASPPTIIEAVFILYYSQHWYIIEATTWVYVLIIVGSLIAEFHGTQGLLRQTTTNLAARTAELESSYAEINLMASELSRKQQLAAVGELAAAIAHEVRNPLAIIMNAVSGMKRPTLAINDRETLLSIVNEETLRLNELVAELLRFARPVTAARSPVSLIDICSRASANAPPGIKLKVRAVADEELGPILVDPGLFRLALDNLIANSCQAMPDGGSIELTVRTGRFSDGSPAAVVDVKDEGVGMRDTELNQARKPFFTTKPRGTGLGLPIAVKIVEAHGGELELQSQVGVGTTVSVVLPLEKAQDQIVAAFSSGLTTANRRRLRSIPPLHDEAVEPFEQTPVFEPSHEPELRDPVDKSIE